MSEPIQYKRIIEAVSSLPWAILPGKLAIIQDLIRFRSQGVRLEAEAIRQRLAAENTREPGPDVMATMVARSGAASRQARGGAVAVLPLLGTIMPRANMMTQFSGATSATQFSKLLRAAVADPEISAIVLDVDSPGGQVGMIPELAAEIFNARQEKRIVAVANNLMASAAYWVASAASEVAITPSGELGSIGVLAIHEDISDQLEADGVKITTIAAGEFKNEASPFERLTAEARKAIQDKVDQYYAMFTQDVARFRGVAVRQVIDGFGQGRTVLADQAVQLGMADRVATLDTVIAELLDQGAIDAATGFSSQAPGAQDLRQRRLRLESRR